MPAERAAAHLSTSVAATPPRSVDQDGDQVGDRVSRRAPPLYLYIKLSVTPCPSAAPCIKLQAILVVVVVVESDLWIVGSPSPDRSVLCLPSEFAMAS